MAIQVLPAQKQPTGNPFTEGLSRAFEGLTQHKLQQYAQRQHHGQITQALKALNIPEHVANLPENLQAVYLKQHLAGQQQNTLADVVSSIFGGEQGQQVGGQEAQMAPAEHSQQPQRTMTQQQAQPKPTQKGPSPEQLAKLNPQQLMQVASLGLKKSAMEEKSMRDAYQYTKKYSEQSQKDANIARKTTNSYKNIINLAKSGNVRSGGWFNALDSLGLNKYYRNPATQLAQKEIASLAQGAASAFNTPRLNAMEVDLYQKSLIEMGNTPEAMITIAKNEILKNDASLLKENTRREIIRENGNKPPYDLSEQVYDRVEPQLQQMAQIALDNVKLTAQDAALTDASNYSPDTVIRVDGIEYKPQGEYWVRAENGS